MAFTSFTRTVSSNPGHQPCGGSHSPGFFFFFFGRRDSDSDKCADVRPGDLNPRQTWLFLNSSVCLFPSDFSLLAGSLQQGTAGSLLSSLRSTGESLSLLACASPVARGECRVSCVVRTRRRLTRSLCLGLAGTHDGNRCLVFGVDAGDLSAHFLIIQ